jgi:hypothetical protein
MLDAQGEVIVLTRRIRGCLAVVTASLPAAPLASQVPAGVVQFDQTSDAIQVSGGTELGTAATFEARFYLPSGSNGGGTIFNEWTFGLEDKALGAGPDGLGGFAFNTGALLQYSTTVSLDAWHHVAFVHDGPGNEQRFYLDGGKVASQTASGDIGDGGGDPVLGAIFRDSIVAPSFRGYLDTFRVSDHARYSGDSFTAPSGDLSDDANTVILFNFDADDFSFGQGAATVADHSGNGHTGTLAASFVGATYPGLPGTLDVDDNGTTDALTDGLVVLRFIFGFTGTTLTANAVGGGCGRCDDASIGPYVAALAANLDIDDDGSLGALTDGLLVLRYLFGFTGSTLTAGAVGNDCDRCDAAAIVPYLQLID